MLFHVFYINEQRHKKMNIVINTYKTLNFFILYFIRFSHDSYFVLRKCQAGNAFFEKVSSMSYSVSELF